MTESRPPEPPTSFSLSRRLFPAMVGASGVSISSEIGTEFTGELLAGRVPLGDLFYASFDSEFYAPWSWLRWLWEYGNSADPYVRHAVRHGAAGVLAGIAVSVLAGVLLSRWMWRSAL